MLQFHPLTIIEHVAVATDAVSLTFDVPAPLREAYGFEPGQHVAVRAMVGGVAVRRTYSIVNARDELIRIGVRVQGTMSRHLAEGVRVGDTLDVMTPTGHFGPTPARGNGRSFAAFAAGSGITPVLSIATSVLAADREARFQVFYGNRDTARAMFVPELLALKDRYLTRFSVHFLMSREPQEIELFNGRLDGRKLRELVGRVFDPHRVDEFFLCGPDTMADELERVLSELGAAGQVHVERFAAGRRSPREIADRSAANAKPEAWEAVEVVALMDGRRRTFAMPPRGPSILQAAEGAGLELPFSCRDGICSTCRVKVLEGNVEMARNQALEPWEVKAGFVLCCQARPTSARVVLSYDEK